MWGVPPVNGILMETEGPGFDSQERHLAPVAQLVERRSYTDCIHNVATGECRGFNPHLEHFFLSLYDQKNVFF
jgi:hypothetical protein